MSALDALESSLDSASLPRQVEIGSILWELGDKVRAILEGIKETMREEAISQLKGQEGTTVLKGDNVGEVSVKVPKTSLRVPKGVVISDLKRILGADFGLFFEEVVTLKPREEFEERAAVVTNPLHQQVLHSSVQHVEGTPRVSFRRHKPPQQEG